MKEQVNLQPEKRNGSPGKAQVSPIGKGPVVRQVDRIIDRAVEMGASDIHFEPYEEQFRVRYRLDGILQAIGTLSVRQKDAVISRIKIMADLDIAEKRRPQDGRIRVDRKNSQVDLRVSTLPTDFGEKIVLRILDRNRQKLELSGLGFDRRALKQFHKAIHHPYGMILVTGPTGSGKTTSLYAALNELNTREVNITTIEDPIEYHLEGINQTRVRTDIGLTFSNALRSILRQDPNIIMVGEIRDRDTAEIAIRSALTGHLVFSTLHTNDAPSALVRLLDMGIEPFLVASSVRLVMAQRLVRKVCHNCKAEQSAGLALLNELGVEDQSEPIVQGTGCESCNGTGYRGRTALVELMPMSAAISEIITGREGAGNLKQQAVKEGMVTLRQQGIQKIREGITTPDEVIRETIQ